MTVIAFDGRTVAADRQGTSAGVRRNVTKLIRADDGAVLSFSGDAAHGLEMIAWYNAGRDPNQFPTSREPGAGPNSGAFLHVFQVGRKVMTYEWGPFPLIWEDRQFAAGNGQLAAMAAMVMGADARRAVEIACQLVDGCGGGVDVMELHSDTNGAAGTEPVPPRPAAVSHG